jgi:hypothetical protein
LRPFSGSSRTCSPLITPETSPPTVLTGVDSAFTSTLSDKAPAASSKSILRSSATLRVMSVRFAVLKPWSSTVIEYRPTGNSLTEYNPSVFVVTVRVKPVS